MSVAAAGWTKGPPPTPGWWWLWWPSAGVVEAQKVATGCGLLGVGGEVWHAPIAGPPEPPLDVPVLSEAMAVVLRELARHELPVARDRIYAVVGKSIPRAGLLPTLVRLGRLGLAESRDDGERWGLTPAGVIVARLLLAAQGERLS